MTNSAHRLDAIDGARAISALMVVAAHLWQTSHLPDPTALFGLGRLGVEIFFCISGFVICRGLLVEEQTNRSVSILGFYVRRSFRILPPLALYIGAVWLLAHQGYLEPTAKGVARGLTFTCNQALNLSCGGYLGTHLWSLSFEEQFYVAFPAIFVVARAKRGPALLTIALALALAVVGLRAIQVWPGWAAGFSTLAIGAAAAVYEQKLRLRCASLSAWLVPIAIGFCAVTYLLPDYGWVLALKTIACPSLIVFSLFNLAFRRSALREVISAPPLRYLGRISYSVYLWQQLATFGLSGTSIWVRLAAVTLCITLSALSFRFYERPLLRLAAVLSRRLNSKSSAHAVATGGAH